jgi:hypothetical protein
MLAGLLVLRPGFQGRARQWWDIALGMQVWHHFEHALLQCQAIFGANLFGSPVPISIAQLVIPRVELHLLYNGMVFIPMVIAMYYHVYPSPRDLISTRGRVCDCGLRPATPRVTT